MGETSLDLVPDSAGGGFILGSRWVGAMGMEQSPVLIRIDAGGNLIWQKAYIDNAYGSDTYASITDVHAIPGGFIAVGSTAQTSGGTPEVFLLKTDTSGLPIAGWPVTYGDVDLILTAAGLETAANGDYLLACGFKGQPWGNGTYLIRTDSAGAVIWCKIFGQFDPTDSIEETTPGNIVLAGKVPGSDAGMLLTNPSGVFQWCWDYTYGGTSETLGESVVPTNDGGYMLAAWTQFLPTDFDFYAIKTDPAGSSGCNEAPFSPDLADRTPLVGDTVFARIEPTIWASLLYTEAPADSLETVLCLSGDPCVDPVCPCPLGTVVLGGMYDGFMPPPDPASPSADLVTFVVANDYLNRPPMDFDEIPGLTVGLDLLPTGDNRYFGHTFAGLPQNIVAASLEISIRLTTAGPIGDTDVLALWLSSPTGPFAWGRLIEDLNGGPGSWSVGGSVATLTLDLAALPLAAGGTQCILPEINSNQSLDVMVQDDTGVDYIRLTLLSCPPCADPPPGMVAWWPLDELEDLGVNADGADDVFDLTPNANHGDTVAGPTPLLGEMVDNSLCFNGTTQYVEVPNAPVLNFGLGNFSIDAWINTDNTAGVQKIVDKRLEAGTSTTGYSFFVSSGNLAFQIADGAGGPVCDFCPGSTSSCTNYDSGVFVATGEWVHVAVTVDRGLGGGTFYVDGMPTGNFDPNCHPLSVTNTRPLRIGSRSSTVTGLFDGCIDEVELFNRVLTDPEVFSIYIAGALGKCKPHCDCLGDVNGDGLIDWLDVAPFVRCLLGTSIAGDNCACADINGDGVVNGLDIGPFVDLLIDQATCGCGPTLDESECKDVTCPDPTQECVPTCMNFIQVGGQTIVTVRECDCLDPGECHAEFQQGGVPFCAGDCPPDETCVQTVTDDGVGGWDTCCRCEPTGACCLEDGQCIQTTADDCQDQNGQYFGNGTPCLGIEACCWDEPGTGTSCVEVDQLCCEAIFGGTPQGTGTSCLPEGACCYDADSDGVPEVCEVMAEVCCDDVGGTFQGVNTVCLGVGACCYGPAMPICVEIDEICCDDIGGTFMGLGTNCQGDNNGNNIDDACECGPTSNGSNCNPVTCPVPAEECIPTCVHFNPVTLQFTVIDCDCRPTNECYVIFDPAVGPFCNGVCPPDETCVETITPDGSGGWETCCRCEANGACCLPNGDCIQTTADDCQSQSGQYFGNGTPCGGIEACCWNEPGIGMSCVEVDQLCCAAIFGGTSQGAGTSCQPTGACCYDADGDGIPEVCEVMAEVCCDDVGGTFQGAGTTCLGVGACCYGLALDLCVEIDELCCDDIFGSFLGVGSICLGDGNGNGIDDACEQGNLCPLLPPPLEDHCAMWQLDDCQLADPPANETCLPKVVHFVDGPPPAVRVTECACFLPGECGVVDIDTGALVLSCPGTDCVVGEECLIYVDGVVTASSSIDYGTVGPNIPITCECGP